MEKLKNNKLIYLIICIITIIICLIIYIAKNNDNTYVIENNMINNNTNNFISEEEKNEKEEKEETVFIHIIGEVNKPGVVEVKKGSRIKDVIEQAGGITENADIEKVNLVYEVSDGQKINIPNKNETKEDKLNENNYVSTENNVIIGEMNKENKKVNINTATQTELETITGIGPSTASKIIKYRSENGKFKNINDIKNVSGIGDAKFNSIKDEITV